MECGINGVVQLLCFWPVSRQFCDWQLGPIEKEERC